MHNQTYCGFDGISNAVRHLFAQRPVTLLVAAAFDV
jgi:hypothetical protein